MRNVARTGLVAVVVAALALGGCSTSKPGSDPTCQSAARDVDLLLVIDDSGSMAEEQAAFAAILPGVIAAAVDAAGSVRVGVITTDLGNLGNPIPTCASELGDDALLQTTGDASDTACAATYPPYGDAGPDATSAVRVGTAASCLVRGAGTSGCGWEQQLEAMLKAITPSGSTIRFHGDTTGQGGSGNGDFLRPGAVLVVVLLSDEDDCSVSDAEMLDPSSTTYTADLNLRCFAHADSGLHPLARYVDGLLALRPPGEVAVAAIAGLPPDLEGTDPTTALADPRLEPRIDPLSPNRLEPSCDTATRGLAFPPQRLVRFTEALAARDVPVALGSLCGDQTGVAPLLAALVQQTQVRCE